MAMNVPLTGEGNNRFPLPFQGEVFLLTRDKTEVSFKDATRSVKRLKGRLFLTNLRMVLLIKESERQKAGGETFEMPFRGIWEESFNQPIFGCNNLTSAVQYYDGQPFSGELTMRIDFIEGGVNTFLPIFTNVLQATRIQIENEHRGQNNIPAVAVNETTPLPQEYFPNRNAAFIDPHDPSQIYATQPSMGSQQPRTEAPSWSVSGKNLRRR